MEVTESAKLDGCPGLTLRESSVDGLRGSLGKGMLNSFPDDRHEQPKLRNTALGQLVL